MSRMVANDLSRAWMLHRPSLRASMPSTQRFPKFFDQILRFKRLLQQDDASISEQPVF